MEFRLFARVFAFLFAYVASLKKSWSRQQNQLNHDVLGCTGSERLALDSQATEDFLGLARHRTTSEHYYKLNMSRLSRVLGPGMISAITTFGIA